jgi:hypothetical protein
MFGNGSGISQSSNLFWDNTNGRLGIGTNSPTNPVNIVSNIFPQMVLKSTSDVGVYLDRGTGATNQFRFLTNGTERWRFGSTNGATEDLMYTRFNGSWIDTLVLQHSTGNVGIGTTSPVSPLDVRVSGTAGTGSLIASLGSAATARIQFYDENVSTGAGPKLVSQAGNSFQVVAGGTGGVQLGSGATAWSAISDERRKNILYDIKGGLDKILDLRTVIYTYKDDAQAIQHPGFIAQDVQKVLPQAVEVGSDLDHTLSVRYSEIIPLVVSAQKDFYTKLETGFTTVSEKDLVSWTDAGAITTLTDSVRNETPRNALSYITQKMLAGYKAVSDFTTLRITAIQGYFENIFAKKATLDEVCVKKADGSYVCLTGDDLEKIKTSVSTPSNSGGTAGDASNSSASSTTSSDASSSATSTATSSDSTTTSGGNSSSTDPSTPVESPAPETTPLSE